MFRTVYPQDTVVALKALAAFADRDTNRDLYNMLVHIESTGTDNWTQEVQLKKGSYVTYKTFSVSTRVHCEWCALCVIVKCSVKCCERINISLYLVFQSQ